MKPNGQPPNNNSVNSSGNQNYFIQRGRLLSMNTPKLSPLRMVQSPFPINDPNFFDTGMNIGNDFRLQEPQPTQQYVEPVHQSQDQSYSQIQFPKFPQNEEVTKEYQLIQNSNMIEFLVATINIDEERIHRIRQEMQRSGQTFLAEIFQYLYKRFKKTKKTKEEMIKYTMRKSFKFITDQMKKDDPSLIPILSTDGIEGMSIYFTKNSNDKDISIPFKKNSAEKTMNTAFLKSVFSVEQFTRDYKKFLKTFQNEFIRDNTKKINSMTDAVKASISSKNYKSLQNYKRIPWTTDILAKLKSFAVDLLNYSPHKGGHSSDSSERDDRQKSVKERVKGESQEAPVHRQRKTSFQIHTEYYNNNGNINHKQQGDQRHGNMMHRRLSCDDHFKDFINDQDHENDLVEHITQQRQNRIKKKSVIILTPPMMPMNSPPLIPDDSDPLE